MKCYFDDEEFGRIQVYVRRGIKMIRFKWRDGLPQMVVPYGVPPADVLKMVDDNREKIRQLNRGCLSFYEGQVIPCFRSAITITTDARLQNQIACGCQRGDIAAMYVHLPAGVDFASATILRNISSVITKLLVPAAERHLIPYAWTEADRLGLRPVRFEIGRGKRKLGHCTSQGVIQLSRFLMLMPEPLVQGVVCHELAHLTHHNHSQEFYDLLDTYLGGSHAAIDDQINHFAWPILR